MYDFIVAIPVLDVKTHSLYLDHKYIKTFLEYDISYFFVGDVIYFFSPMKGFFSIMNLFRRTKSLSVLNHTPQSG